MTANDGRTTVDGDRTTTNGGRSAVDGGRTTTNGDRASRPNATTRADRRGQTMPDFLVGISVFLVTVAFVVAFVPGMLVPYQDGDHASVGERVGGTLTGHLLADPARPSALDENCTVAFLTQTGGGGCPFDTATPVTEQVGIESHHGVNVTLGRAVAGGGPPEILCADDGTIVACGTDRLAVGKSVPTSSRSVATARRTVFVGGTDAVLEVAVW